VKEQACTVSIDFMGTYTTQILAKRIKTSGIYSYFGGGNETETPGMFSFGDLQKPVQKRLQISSADTSSKPFTEHTTSS